jgi:hypothetical protein
MIKVRKQTTTMLKMKQTKMTIQNLLFHRTPHKSNVNIASVGRASQMNKTNKCGGMIVQRPLTKQMWWHDRAEAPHQRSSGLRKEQYKRFWTMLLHRGAWDDDRYLLMKTDASARDHRTQRFDWHKRDIMPKCVVTLVRHWFPNPGGFPYMGHMWE